MTSKTALIVVDIQNDYFPGGLWALKNVEAAAKNAALVIAFFRERGDLVVHIRHEFTSDEAPFFRPGIEAVVVVGNMSHMCVDGITRASVDFGYSTTVLHDACATLDLEFNGVNVPAEHVHAAFMAALRFGYAAVISTSEYLNKAKEIP